MPGWSNQVKLVEPAVAFRPIQRPFAPAVRVSEAVRRDSMSIRLQFLATTVGTFEDRGGSVCDVELVANKSANVFGDVLILCMNPNAGLERDLPPESL